MRRKLFFDYTYLSRIPNMHICAPKNKWELSDMMKFAVALDAPIAVRYPRGSMPDLPNTVPPLNWARRSGSQERAVSHCL